MTIEELQKSLQDAAEARKSEVAALEERLKKAEDNEAIKSLQKDLTDSQEAIKALNLKLKSLEEAPAAPKEIAEFLKSEVGVKMLADAKTGASNEGIKLKSVNDMTIANTVLPTVADGVLASLIDGNGEVYLINRMAGSDDILQAVSVTSTNSALIVDVEEEEGTGEPEENAEGEEIESVDTKFQEKRSDAIEISGKMKVSERMLTDIAYMASIITQVLNNKYMAAKQKNIVLDIISKATTFDNATTLYPTQAAPNWFDAINACAAQSASIGELPDAVLMNSVDAYALRSVKDQNGQPIIAFWNDGKTAFLNNGMKMLISKKCTRGTIVTGTFKNYDVKDLDLMLTIGYDGYDFGKNRRTVKVVGRFHKKIAANKNNFVKGVVATVITALTAPVVP